MKVTMIISMYTYSYHAFGYWVRNESVSWGLPSQKLTIYGYFMSSTGWVCDCSLLPHFPSASQSCRSLSNCSCPITFAGSLSTDGISGTSQSTQQCRAILTKTHTYIYKHTHKHTHPHRDAHTHIYTNTHTSTHTLARCRLTDTARLTQTNHPIANYYMPYIPTAIL